MNSGFLTLDLEWDPNFRPDELEQVVRYDGNDRRFRLIDADAKSATLQGPDSIGAGEREPAGSVIRVLPGRKRRMFRRSPGRSSTRTDDRFRAHMSPSQ